MFKLLALAAVASAASQTDMPNSFRVAGGCAKVQFADHTAVGSHFVPSFVEDCPCLTGYEHTDGNVNCVAKQIACPANSVANSVTQGGTCQCSAGYTEVYQNGKVQCHYAYLFHVHGRMWLNGMSVADAKKFATRTPTADSKFSAALGSALKIPAKDILPYHVYQVKNPTADAYQMEAQHNEILMKGKDHSSLSPNAVAIAFAIRDETSNLSEGYRTVHELTSASNSDVITALANAGASVTAVHTLVWALQSEMWKPAASIKHGKACAHDYQCVGRLHCAPAHGLAGGKVCRSGYAWAKGSESEYQPTSQPTNPPTDNTLPEGKASLTFNIEIGCGNPMFTAKDGNYAARKTAIENSLMKRLAINAPEDVAAVRVTNTHNWNDYQRNNENDPFRLTYTTTQNNHLVRGGIVSIDIHGITSHELMTSLIGNLAAPATRTALEQGMWEDTKSFFGNDKSGVSDDTCILVHDQSMDVHIAEVAPTPAPRFIGSWETDISTNLHPEASVYDCSCGTVMEINMGARVVSSVDLMQPVEHNSEMSLNLKEFLTLSRQCLAGVIRDQVPALTEDTMPGCQINAKPIPTTSKVFRANPGFFVKGGVYDDKEANRDAPKNKWQARGWDYAYKFSVAVEGMDMNLGNDVFNAVNQGGTKLADEINKCMFPEVRRSQTMFGTDHATFAHNSDDITTGDITVKGEKERWLPYFNETSFYSMEASSIQLAFKQGNCKQIKDHIPHQNEEPVNTPCKYSEWSAWTAPDKACVHEGETATRHRFRVVTELNQGNGTQCSDDPAFYKDSETVSGVPLCANDCSKSFGPWQDGKAGDSKPCADGNCDHWSEVTCRDHSGKKATCEAQLRSNKRIRSRSLLASFTESQRYKDFLAGKEDKLFNNCADTSNPDYVLEQSIACTTNKECAIDCVRSGHASEGQCSHSCKCPQDASGAFLENCNGRNGASDMTNPTFTRTYHVQVPAANGGAQCPTTCDPDCKTGDNRPKCKNMENCLQTSEPCMQQACPTICKMGAWSAWGSCDDSCDGKAPGYRISGAKQMRVRDANEKLIAALNGQPGLSCGAESQTRLCALHPCGSHVCKAGKGKLPLTCTYNDDTDIVYTHHVNDVHDNELFMCYHNKVTAVCTCLCWQKADIAKHTGLSAKKQYSNAEHNQMITALHSDKYHVADAATFDRDAEVKVGDKTYTGVHHTNRHVPDHIAKAKSGSILGQTADKGGRDQGSIERPNTGSNTYYDNNGNVVQP
jgi:hypothetical protein